MDGREVNVRSVSPVPGTQPTHNIIMIIDMRTFLQVRRRVLNDVSKVFHC